jgi:hypothetical protein
MLMLLEWTMRKLFPPIDWDEEKRKHREENKTNK